MTRISVILSSYNHGSFIKEAIDSVLSQSYSDFELLILDDNSTDDSWSIISSYTDPRIKAVRNVNKGQFIPALTDLIENVSTGEYIAIHHSDDAWETKKLEKQVAVLDRDTAIGAVFTNVAVMTEDGAPFTDTSHFYFQVFEQPNRSRHEWLRYFFSYGNALCHPSAVIRRGPFAECGYYDPSLWQLSDFDLWIRLAMKCELHVLPERLTRFRIRNNPETQVSGNFRESRLRSSYELLHIMENYRSIPDLDELCLVFPEAKKYLRKDFNDHIFVLGSICLELASNPVIKLFALNILHDAIKSPHRANKILEAYNFDIIDLVRLTGEHDVFSIEIDKRDSRIAELERSMAELRNSTSWRLTAPLRLLANRLRTR